MKTNSVFTFKYNFRTPGNQVKDSIRSAVGRTVLGMVLVDRSQHGICAIFLGEDAQALRDQLAAEFPSINLQTDRASLQCELNQVIGFIDKDQSEGIFNLDIGDIEFEQKVWQSLCGIPSGKTCSYGDVARDLGVPEIVRAVAGAYAVNVLIITIPCHRVVRSDGSISGHLWGALRKRTRLVEEVTEGAMEFAA